MADLTDPGRKAIEADLRSFRKGGGEPTEARLGGLFDLTEALGEGISERAFVALSRYYETHGTDPETDIGAYFYLAGWGVGGHSVDQRRGWYRDAFFVDISTAWRRAERGLKQLAALIRDHTEHSRPWAVISVFQTGGNFQAFLDFNLGYESWRPPAVYLNGEEVTDIEFRLHTADTSDPNRQGPGTRYVSRTVLPETPLDLRGETEEALGSVRVIWDMPVWPVWQTLGWTTNPNIYLRTRTFRQRAIETSFWRVESSGD
jgi:hypothetical protein